MQTFIISLNHETARQQSMVNKLKHTNITEYKFVDAVDGNTDLHKYDFKVMPDWVDPVHKRKINVGEIGCFLSHYSIWKQIIDNDIDIALILEDDCIFLDDFSLKLTKILQLDPATYDYFSLGRNRLCNIYNLGAEHNINNDFVIPKYSYCTQSYLLTNTGAKILANSLALQYIIPVDEYISIMYDSFPFPQYSVYFKNVKKLRAIGLIKDITQQDRFKSSINNATVFEYFTNQPHQTIFEQNKLKIKTQNSYMEKTLRIFDKFFDNALYNECYEYSISKIGSPEISFRTNLFWEPGIVKDSNLVLIHVLSHDNHLHTKISDTIKQRCQIDTLKSIMFYYWTQGSHIPWHNDGKHNGGITIYLNKSWDEDWGGIFLYKDGDSINGLYPKQNRCIMQCGGIPHSVAPTSKNSDVRLTIQIFF